MGVLGGGTAVTFIAGIILGVLGIIGVSVNYPIYKESLQIAGACMQKILFGLQTKSAIKYKSLPQEAVL